MREIVISIIVVALILCFALLFSCETIVNKIENNKRDKIEIQVGEYRTEKRELEKELKSIVNARNKTISGIFRLMLVITEADELFVNEIYPLFRDNNIPATICFDLETIPGNNSSVSLEMYNSLLESGWATALYYDGSVAVSEWYSDYENAINPLEFGLPSVVVVDNSSFSHDVAEELYSVGFVDIIVKSIKANVDRADIQGGARLTDSVGWCTFTASDLIKNYLPQNGDVAFTIGGENPEEMYESEQFARMLIAIDEIVRKEKLFFTTPKGAEAYKQKLRDEDLLTIDDYNKKKNQLETRIKELEKLIQEQYDDYLVGE